MRRARFLLGALAAILALDAPPSRAGEADAALSVTAVVLDRCVVGAQVDSGEAVRLSLRCPRQSGCAAGFGPLDGPQPIEAAGLNRCRLELRMTPPPLVTVGPNLFQVDF